MAGSGSDRVGDRDSKIVVATPTKATAVAAAARAAGAACRAAGAAARAAGWLIDSSCLVTAAATCDAVEASVLSRSYGGQQVQDRLPAAAAEMEVQGAVAQATGEWPHSGGMAALRLRQLAPLEVANGARRLARRGGRRRHAQEAGIAPGDALDEVRTVAAVRGALGLDDSCSDSTQRPVPLPEHGVDGRGGGSCGGGGGCSVGGGDRCGDVDANSEKALKEKPKKEDPKKEVAKTDGPKQEPMAAPFDSADGDEAAGPGPVVLSVTSLGHKAPDWAPPGPREGVRSRVLSPPGWVRFLPAAAQAQARALAAVSAVDVAARVNKGLQRAP